MYGGLYGHRHIDDDCLKKWIQDLNWDRFRTFINDYTTGDVHPFLEELAMKNLSTVKNMDFSHPDGQYLYDSMYGNMSDYMRYCFFRSGPSSASVANFHEVLLAPSDVKTYHRMISGYIGDIPKIGSIHISIAGETIGHIGEMSDLFWGAFYDHYVHEIPVGNAMTPRHTRDNSPDITLQLWKPGLLPTDENLDQLVEQIIYFCSVNLGLNFKRDYFDAPQLNTEDILCNTSLELPELSLEVAPMQYFNFALNTRIPRIQFHSYYQVVEFFYTRATNFNLYYGLLGAKVHEPNEVDFIQIRDTIRTFQNNSRERESFKLVVSPALNVEDIQSWLEEDASRLEYYTTPIAENPVLKPISIRDEKSLITSISERIYNIRCSLVHSKGDAKEFVFIPGLNDSLIINEVPLMRFVATKVLEHWSSKRLS